MALPKDLFTAQTVGTLGSNRPETSREQLRASTDETRRSDCTSNNILCRRRLVCWEEGWEGGLVAQSDHDQVGDGLRRKKRGASQGQGRRFLLGSGARTVSHVNVGRSARHGRCR